jgi:hypothetical protein
MLMIFTPITISGIDSMHTVLMIFTPITISGIDSIHTVFTEIGENASIQRQLTTPLTGG